MKQVSLIFTFIFFAFLSGCKLDSDGIIESPTPPEVQRISIFPSQISVDRISSVVNPDDIIDTTILVSVAAAGVSSKATGMNFRILSAEGIVLATSVGLNDSGTTPDSVANDGIYTGKASISFKKKNLGNYTVQIFINNGSGYSVTSLNTFSVINPLIKIPQVVSVEIAGSSYIADGSDSVLVQLTAKVSDPQGLADIKTVSALITSISGEQQFSVNLFDDGGAILVPPFSLSSGDAVAGDSIFSCKILFRKKDVDDYLIRVTAKDSSESSSNTMNKTITIRNQHNAQPVIAFVSQPDSAFVPFGSDTTFITIAVTVNDPQGIDDIRTVSFGSYRPDNSYVGSYDLYDDGSAIVRTIYAGYNAVSGDTTAHDGVYTITIPITNASARQTFRDFKFQAQDRAGEVSSVVTKRIYLK